MHAVEMGVRYPAQGKADDITVICAQIHTRDGNEPTGVDALSTNGSINDSFSTEDLWLYNFTFSFYSLSSLFFRLLLAAQLGFKDQQARFGYQVSGRLA